MESGSEKIKKGCNTELIGVILVIGIGKHCTLTNENSGWRPLSASGRRAADGVSEGGYPKNPERSILRGWCFYPWVLGGEEEVDEENDEILFGSVHWPVRIRDADGLKRGDGLRGPERAGRAAWDPDPRTG